MVRFCSDLFRPVFALIYLTTCLAPAASAEETRTQPERLARIIGGQGATAGEYPFATALLMKYVTRNLPGGDFELNFFGCGSTLISNQYILSAAHCFDTQIIFPVAGINRTFFLESVTAKIGVLDRINETGESQIIPASAIIKHPDYDDETQQNDIALLRLPTRTNKQFAYIPDDETDEILTEGTGVTAVGWGATIEGGPAVPFLQEVDLHIIGNETCAQQYSVAGSEITSDMLCAADPAQDTCQGDSGGPLLVQENGRSYLVGLTSFGIGCARAAFPGVYTRVANYREWIVDNTTDTNLPEVQILAPQAAQVIRRSTELIATVFDNIGVGQVQFVVDNAVVQSFTNAPYTFNLNTSAFSNANHTFRINAFDVHGNVTSRSVVFNVDNRVPVSIVTHPASRIAAKDASVTFSVTAEGTSPTYQWQFKSNTANSAFANISGASSASYTFNAALTKAGTYRVIVANGLGSVTSNPATLAVQELPKITTQPPATRRATVGTSTTLSVAASGTALTYEWQLKRPGSDFAVVASGNSNTLNLAIDASLDAARVKVRVFNAVGSVLSNETAITAVTPVAITASPESVLNKPINQSVTFNVTASGTSPTYRWQFRTATGTTWSNISGATAASYTLTATVAKAGSYRVIVNNAANLPQTSAAATLSVIDLPKITTSPVSITRRLNETAVFSVIARNGTLSYQWQSKPVTGGSWTNISGATSSTFSIVTSAATAIRYRVVVMNEAGSVTSGEARLTLR